VLFAIGKSWADVRVVPDGALGAFPDGPDVTVLIVNATPYPVPVNRAVSVTFTATDSSGQAVTGTVKKNGAAIGTTNTPLSHTFRATRKMVDGDWEMTYPTVTVEVPGFPEETVDCGWL
jgi:hypothetical protein